VDKLEVGVVRPEVSVDKLETEAVETKGEVFWAWVVPPEKDSGESTREREREREIILCGAGKCKRKSRFFS
jgi:hypothetical protein